MIRTEKITATVAGSAGSATGEATSVHPVNGLLIAIYIDYTTQPATADVTITTRHAPVKTLLTASNNGTDAWYYPRFLAHSDAGVASTTDLIYHPIDDYIKIAVAQGDAGSVDVYVLYAGGD